MKKYIFTSLLLCALIANTTIANASDVAYTADNTTIFPNPERGFITMLEGKLSNEKHYAVKGKESYLDNHKNNDHGSLILVLYYLDSFKDCDLPDWVLSAFDEDMAVLRARGMKCILRFAYTNTTYKYPNPDPTKDSIRSAADASLAVIERHLEQYKRHWADNTDVIFVFQAGFIGAYGEWYYTDNFTNTSSHMTEERTAFLDTLLKAVPANRAIQIRTPRFKEEYISGVRNGHPAALTAEEAYTGTAKARIAHHNDAFLYHYDNMGTYSDTSIQKPYIAQETLYLPIGGESDITDDAQAAVEAAHDVAIAEMSRLHWTFIQSGYSRTVTDMWRANGTFDELNRKLGYRYQLVSGTYSDALEANEKLSVNIQIRNAGFAPLYNERPAYIVLKNGNKMYPLLLASDPRTWLPNGVVSTVNEQLSLPDGIENGTYQLYLYLPDAYESIAEDPRYAVRFANTDVWDAASGMNNLNATVTISGGEEQEYTSISLPATLNKENHLAHSDNTWYGEDGDYFDFESGGGNLSRWIEWEVKLTTPGKYSVSELTYCATGHNYAIELWQGSDSITTYLTSKTYDTGELNITQEPKWDLAKVPAGTYTIRVKNAMEWGKPKLKSLTIDLFGAVSSDTINLPATLDKTNVADFSEKIGWYETDCFDFGVKDAANTDHTVDWRVYLCYPGDYMVSTSGFYPNGHQWQIQLLNSSAEIYALPKISTTGEVTELGEAKWNLSNVPAGVYTLRINNIYAWGRPKLKSLTLEYDGEIPTVIPQEAATPAVNGIYYDLLGRRVSAGYKGIVIHNGSKILIR